MKRFFAVLLALCLAGCSAPGSVSGPAASAAVPVEEARTCRIADGRKAAACCWPNSGKMGAFTA